MQEYHMDVQKGDFFLMTNMSVFLYNVSTNLPVINYDFGFGKVTMRLLVKKRTRCDRMWSQHKVDTYRNKWSSSH